MTTYVMRDGKLVEKRHAPPRDIVHVISDSIPDLRHPANGKRYDSKSTFRRVTKDHGYVEVGNEKQVDRRKPLHPDFTTDVHEAIRKVNEGYKPDVQPLYRDFSGDGWQ